jgi:hypothetical protein
MFDNFLPARGTRPRSHRAFPGEREQLAVQTRAQPVRALAGHAHVRGSLGHAAGFGEDLKKKKLALGRPAIVANFPPSRRFRRAHRPAWTTNAAL